MISWEEIKERIYRISPTYRMLRKLNLKLCSIEESKSNNVLQFEVHNFSKAQASKKNFCGTEAIVVFK
jgi:hypothetical protein